MGYYSYIAFIGLDIAWSTVRSGRKEQVVQCGREWSCRACTHSFWRIQPQFLRLAPAVRRSVGMLPGSMNERL